MLQNNFLIFISYLFLQGIQSDILASQLPESLVELRHSDQTYPNYSMQTHQWNYVRESTVSMLWGRE